MTAPTPFDAAGIRARHQEAKRGTDPHWCIADGEPWPCSAIAALAWGEQMQAERDSAREELSDLYCSDYCSTAGHTKRCDELTAVLATPAEPRP